MSESGFIHLTEDNERVCRLLGEAFERAGESLYLVGGAVRDVLLGRGGQADLDFTTSAPAAEIHIIVRPLARACYDKSRAKGYGTHGVQLRNGPEVEITPYRLAAPFGPDVQIGDSEISGQTAALAVSATLEQDLHSRDFTINAIAVNVIPAGFGEIADPCGGIADLEKRVLKTPGAPESTFLDDPLRLIRAARFAADFDFEIERDTLDEIKRLAASRPSPLERVAAERIHDELIKMLSLKKPSLAFELMLSAGLLEIILPELVALFHLEPDVDAHHKNNFIHTMRVIDQLAESLAEADPVLMFAALMHDTGKPEARVADGEGGYSFAGHDKIGERLASEACKRLRFSNADGARVSRIVRFHHRLHAYTPEWTDAAVRRAVNELGADLDDILALSRADITTSFPALVEYRRAALDDFVERIAALDRAVLLDPKPPIDGYEIMGLLGLSKGGPEVGRATNYLKEQIVSGALEPDDAETARRMVVSREWQREND